MPSVINRSPWLVSVERNRAHDRIFPTNARNAAEAYARDLRARGLKPKLVQLETSFQVRVTGKGRTKSSFVTFKTREGAEAFAKVADADQTRGLYIDYSASQNVSFRELILEYLDVKLKRRKSYPVAKLRLERICREHEDLVCQPFGQLKPSDFHGYIEDRYDDDIQPATIDRDLDDLRAVINWAIKFKQLHIAAHPFHGLTRPKYNNERDRRLRGDEEERLLAAAREDGNEHVHDVIVIALETAMRRGEILALRADWIDVERRCVVLPASVTKTEKPRRVPLTRRALDTLQRRTPALDGRLFPVTGNAIRKSFFERVLPAAGIEGLHFHDLRHEAISRYAESGNFNLLDLAQISGHRDMRMLQRYAHLCTAALASRMDQVHDTRQESRTYRHKGRLRLVVDASPSGREHFVTQRGMA